jgi:SOS-response transcriptional repressor LexA
MPVAIQTRRGQFSVVQADLPGRGQVNVGVLLQEPDSDRLYLRFRRDWESLVDRDGKWLLDDDDLEIFLALAEDLERKAAEMGAERLFEYLESTLSATLRVSNREPVIAEDFQRAVDRLYRRHVESSVLKFRTHLPRYSLQVAAGLFLENREVEEMDWIETPEDLRLTKNMFVAQIAGHSMEPLIPDGALCVFRREVEGAREGRLVLVESLQTSGNNRYAVKRYRSQKVESEGEWRHARIRLESLNPDYPSWDLDPEEEKYRILAEFVRVLD